MVRYVSGGRWDFYGGVRVIFADLRDSDGVRSGILQAKPDIVINLAAQSAVSYSFSHADEVNETCYMGAMRVANAAREAGAWLIQASSSEVYGRGPYEAAVTEDQLIGGTSPYAAAKVGAEEYLQVLKKTYGMPVTIMRPFNTIGRAPIRNNHFVVERAIFQALQHGRIELHDPRPHRDFLFREDHVTAYLAVIAAGANAQGKVYNFCTGENWSIQRMAHWVAADSGDWTGKPVAVVFSAVPDRPLDIPTLHGSSERAREDLGWKPRFTIQEGISKALEEWAKVLEVPHA